MYNLFERDFMSNIERCFDKLVTTVGTSSITGADIYEKKDKVVIQVPVPGFSKEDVKVRTKKDVLIIEARKETCKDSMSEEKQLPDNVGRSRTFLRNYDTRVAVDLTPYNYSEIKASVKNGMLTVDIMLVPKTEETEDIKEIKVE